MTIIYYVFIEILFLTLLVLPSNARKVYLLLYLFIVTLFLGLKTGTYHDFVQYKIYFDRADINGIIFPEITYVYISYYLKKMGLSFYSLTLIYYTILFIYLFKAISLSSVRADISFLFFILFPIFFLSDYIALRQSVTISLFFYATILYIYNNKYRSIIYFIIASLFHYSAILAVLLILILFNLLKKKYNFFIYFSFLLLALILYKILNPIIAYIFQFLPSILLKYIKYILLETDINLLRTFVYIGLYVILLILFLYDKSKNKTNIILFNLYSIGMFISLIGGGSNMNFNRFANYFIISIIVIIPNLIFSKTNLINYKIRILLFYFLIILISIYFYIGIMKSPDVYLDIKFVSFNNLLVRDL